MGIKLTFLDINIMTTNQSNVEKYYQWMQKIKSIHLANTPAMAEGFHRVATHKIISNESRS